MLSPVLLLNPQTPPHHSCSQKTPLAQNTSTNRIQSHITHIQHTSILPTLILTSVVHHPTTSFNSIIIRSNTTPPSVTSSLKFSNRSIAVAVPPLWNKLPPALRHISDPSYELTRISPLAISPQLFHSKLQTLLISKSYPDSSSSPCLPPRLNSKQHPT